MKRLFRWAFYLFLFLAVLVVAGILLLDTIVKEIAISQIRAQTGMDVKIGKLSVGLLSPTFCVEDFTLYNTAEFGGSPFLRMPELYLEYDRPALRCGQLHFKLVRVNLEEIALVKNQSGRFNVAALEKHALPARLPETLPPPSRPAPVAPHTTAPAPATPPAPAPTETQAPAPTPHASAPQLQFTGIDTLNLTLKTGLLVNLGTPAQTETVPFGITNEIFRNVKTESDLAAVAFVLAGKSGLMGKLWAK